VQEGKLFFFSLANCTTTGTTDTTGTTGTTGTIGTTGTTGTETCTSSPASGACCQQPTTIPANRTAWWCNGCNCQDYQDAETAPAGVDCSGCASGGTCNAGAGSCCVLNYPNDWPQAGEGWWCNSCNCNDPNDRASPPVGTKCCDADAAGTTGITTSAQPAAIVSYLPGGKSDCASGANKLHYVNLTTNAECVSNSLTLPYKVKVECYDDCSWRYTMWANGAAFPNQDCTVASYSINATADICGNNLDCVELPTATCGSTGAILQVQCNVCDIPKPSSNTCNKCGLNGGGTTAAVTAAASSATTKAAGAVDESTRSGGLTPGGVVGIVLAAVFLVVVAVGAAIVFRHKSASWVNASRIGGNDSESSEMSEDSESTSAASLSTDVSEST
jgi:hypothetical protein